jgi:hypothetical protein
VAWLLGDILSDNDARIPVFGPHSALRLSRPAAVKTGTTTNYRDNWTLGYTPDYVVGVWAGNSDNSRMIGSSGVTGAAPIWHDVMETIHAGTPERWFPQPPGLQQHEICALSGLLPGPACPDRVREWFRAGTAPTETDTWHLALRIDPATGLLAAPDCPASAAVERVYTVLPPEYAAWAAGAGWAVPPLASAPACGQASTATGVNGAITTPGANAFVRGTVAVQGVAGGRGVNGYRLEVGEGTTPTHWTGLGSGPAASDSRLLGTWDTAGRDSVYTLRLTLVLAAGGEQAILNRVTVDNVPPVAWIAWPGDPADFSDLAPGERFVVQAEAQDNYGVTAVRFTADGQPLGRRSGAPWSLLIDPAPLGAGRHVLSAVAVDRAGNESEPVTVTITTR